MGQTESNFQYESGIAQQFPARKTFYKREKRKIIINKNYDEFKMKGNMKLALILNTYHTDNKKVFQSV